MIKNGTLIMSREGKLRIDLQGTVDTDPFFKTDFLDYLNRSSDGNFANAGNLDSSFVLSGIVDEWVIIGGEVYEIKDKVNGYILSEIGDEYAILTLGNTNLRLELGGYKQDEQ